uniref:Uncharacterized protein n=1 Tax=Eutreptiella gymnastica TaxID=73025 RepID=A0A7S1NVR3_9EUGL
MPQAVYVCAWHPIAVSVLGRWKKPLQSERSRRGTRLYPGAGVVATSDPGPEGQEGNGSGQRVPSANSNSVSHLCDRLNTHTQQPGHGWMGVVVQGGGGENTSSV